MPLAAYAGRDGFCLSTESMPEYEKLIRMEGMDEKYTGDLLEVEEAREEALLEENKKAAQQLMAGENMTETEGGKQDWKGAPTQKQVLYPLEEYQEYEKLIGEFYTIDPTTMADETLFNLDDLLKRDMTLKDPGDGPQILIYHTHSQEGFADSVPGDESMTVVGVGDYLTELLQERYGFKVLHHKGQYDVEKRDYAYAKAAPALEQLLKDNPSIQVVIDLHRDEVPEGTRLLTTLNGKPTARFMFFNGLSRTKKTGEIPYLENPYIEDNLAFAFQMQLACNEYYPGLTRKIYLKGYRYNMHYCPKTLLVELGAQTNTVEEAYNACEPLADMIAKVLLGEE
ncbi:MAG: stage II sporulation protein P [Clostridiales bacterium]|nr:stage II sporulation protein P [Clostridiales bacterium]